MSRWHKAFVSNNNYRLLRELMMKGKAAPYMKTRLAARNEERPVGVNDDCAGGFSTIRPPRAQNEERATLVE